jgi:multidrug efflux pump subunit AcrB
MRVRLPDGSERALAEVASIDTGRGYATINRADRRRVVSVTADVDETRANANEINQQLRNAVLPAMQRDFPGLTYDFEGEQKEQAESLGSLAVNTAVALLVIFGLLGVLFRSYIQPLIVMAAIPFGFVGAVVGHLVMGFDLTLLSMFGLVALTGVVVNDSLIMIDLINRERAAGKPIGPTLIASGTRRFRPILLTTATTFFGLMPMITEQSLQARFLIPMALSLGFGVVFATAITLLLVPAFYQILEDIKLLLTGKRLVNQGQPRSPLEPA